MAKIKATMRLQLDEARGTTTVTPAVDDEGETEEPVPAGPPRSRYERVRNALLRHRIRIHLCSGIEFEMTVFVIGPLIGVVFWTSIVAGVLPAALRSPAGRPAVAAGGTWRADMAAAERKRVSPEPISPEPAPTRV